MRRKESLHIKRVGEESLTIIVNLENAIFPKPARLSKRQIGHLLRNSKHGFFIVFSGKTPVAYAAALTRRLANGKKHGRIYSIGVLKQYQGNGIGSRLLHLIEKWLCEQDVSVISLETKKGAGGASPFFAKKGYTFVCSLPNYYADADGIRMRRNIREQSRPREGSFESAKDRSLRNQQL